MAIAKRSARTGDDSMNVFYPVPKCIELVRFNKSLFHDLPATNIGSKIELLPAELLTKISKYLPLSSRVNLAMSSKHLARFASTNAIISFDPEALTRSDIDLLRKIMPFKIASVLLYQSQIDPLDVWCSHCWNTKYAALEVCHELFWIGTGPALDLRYHLKTEHKRRGKVAVLNMKDIMHLIRGFVCCEKDEYLKKLNRTSFLSLKYRQVNCG